MKTYLLILLITIVAPACLADDPQIHQVIDLRSQSDNPKYFVGFGVRTNTTSGHTFIITGRENPQKMVSEIDLKGFYPVSNPIVDDAVIKNEFEEKHFISNYHHVIFVVDQADYVNARLMITDFEQNPGHYNFVFDNCLNFVNTVIGRIGVLLPAPLLMAPYDYIKGIVNQLSNPGLHYKETAYIKLVPDGFSTTTQILADLNDLSNSAFRITSPSVFQFGRFKNGLFDGYVVTDMGPGGIYDFFYNAGVPDPTKALILKDGQNGMGGSFTNYNSPVTESPTREGIVRTTVVDPTKGNKVSSTYSYNEWTCNESYFNDTSLFSVCTTQTGARIEGDKKLIVEDNYLTYVFNTNRMKMIFESFTFDGSAVYKDRKLYATGHIQFSNGDTYDGDLVNWVYEGKGTYTHPGKTATVFGKPLPFGWGKDPYTTIADWVNGKPAGGANMAPAPSQAVNDPSWYQMPAPPAIQPSLIPPPAVDPPTDLPTAPVTFPPSQPQPTYTLPAGIPAPPAVQPTNMIWDYNTLRWVRP